jgi:hypothetical protein
MPLQLAPNTNTYYIDYGSHEVPVLGLLDFAIYFLLALYWLRDVWFLTEASTVCDVV